MRAAPLRCRDESLNRNDLVTVGSISVGQSATIEQTDMRDENRNAGNAGKERRDCRRCVRNREGKGISLSEAGGDSTLIWI